MAFSARKKRTPLIEESDSSSDGGNVDTEEHLSNEDQTLCIPKLNARSSERIREKRNKKIHVPSKKEVWEKISPGKSPGKYDQLRPRKLVNNFTKENNRYNYDPNETSGSESLEDFIDDDNEDCTMSTSSESDDDRGSETESKKKVTPLRIKGRHHRLRMMSQMEEFTSSDSEPGTDNKNMDDKSEKKENLVPNNSLKVYNQTKQCKTFSLINGDQKQEDLGEQYESYNANGTGFDVSEIGENIIDVESDKDVSDNNEVQARSCKKRNRNVIESDNDSDSSDGEVSGCRNKHKRSFIESDSDEPVAEDMAHSEHSVINSSTPTDSATDKIMTNNGDSVNVLKQLDVEHTDDSGDKANETNLFHTIEKASEEIASGSINGSTSLMCKTTSEQSQDSLTEDDTSNGSCDTDDDDDGDSVDVNDDNNDDDDESDGDNDDDYLNIDTHNSRVRVKKLRKKMEKDKLFEKFRKEREKKLSKSKKC